MDAHYRDYVTAGGAFSGNREPGIPAHQLFTELSWRRDAGLFGSLDFQFVDQFELNDANTAKNEAYALMNARLGYAAKIGRSELTPFVGVNNLLNQRFNGQTRLNAFGGRYFEPSPRIAVFGGVTWRVEL
jgi:iron complex outermembrane receptor protein